MPKEGEKLRFFLDNNVPDAIGRLTFPQESGPF